MPIAGSWTSISAGQWHAVAIRSDGTLWAWGDNRQGQLGDGTTDEHRAPHQVGTDTDWAEVNAGGNYSLARKANGSLWGWGENGSGQLGDGTNTPRFTPVPIATP